MSVRPELQALLDLTHQLLVAAASGELGACEELSRRRDGAIAALVRTRFTSFMRPAERKALEGVARANGEIERQLAARVSELASELHAVRAARAALPHAGRRSRSRGRV